MGCTEWLATASRSSAKTTMVGDGSRALDGSTLGWKSEGASNVLAGQKGNMAADVPKHGFVISHQCSACWFSRPLTA